MVGRTEAAMRLDGLGNQFEQDLLILGLRAQEPAGGRS